VGPKAASTAAAPATDLLPDAPLDVERVRGMDADVTYKALTMRASPNLPLRRVSLGVKLDHGLLTLSPIDFDFPQGRLTGSAVINARNAVQTDAVDMRVTGVQLQEFLSKGSGSPPLEGVLDARAKLTGTGDSVHKAAASSDGEVTLVIPRGVIRQAFAELLGIDASKGLFMLLSKNDHQTEVRCAVADFRVHNGLMQADQIVLDTGVVRDDQPEFHRQAQEVPPDPDQRPDCGGRTTDQSDVRRQDQRRCGSGGRGDRPGGGGQSAAGDPAVRRGGPCP
jgi:uncharacterized protein involved in outer membrane biogenesis